MWRGGLGLACLYPALSFAGASLNGIDVQSLEFVENGAEWKMREQRSEDSNAHGEIPPVGILSLASLILLEESEG
jgi:hypothetical protein